MVLKLVSVKCITKKTFKCLFFHRIGIVEVKLDLHSIKHGRFFGRLVFRTTHPNSNGGHHQSKTSKIGEVRHLSSLQLPVYFCLLRSVYVHSTESNRVGNFPSAHCSPGVDLWGYQHDWACLDWNDSRKSASCTSLALASVYIPFRYCHECCTLCAVVRHSGVPRSGLYAVYG